MTLRMLGKAMRNHYYYACVCWSYSMQDKNIPHKSHGLKRPSVRCGLASLSHWSGCPRHSQNNIGYCATAFIASQNFKVLGTPPGSPCPRICSCGTGGCHENWQRRTAISSPTQMNNMNNNDWSGGRISSML